MAQVKTVSGKKETWKERCARTAREVVKRRWLFFLLIPGIIFFAVFKYIPMYGLKIAFQDYNQYDPSKSQWVGFQQFMDLFSKKLILTGSTEHDCHQSFKTDPGIPDSGYPGTDDE